MARVARLAGFALALAVIASPKPSLADDDTDRAEQSFSEGNRAFAAGDYHAAFEAYRAAWLLKQTFDIACNLGRTEVELSLSRDAAEHLDYCLRTFSVSSRGDVRDANKRFHELFARVRRQVSALTVDVRPTGAELTVDGASYGVAPLGHDIFLAPGQHVVRAHLTGFEDEVRSITAEAGASIGVTLLLTPVRAARPAAATAGVVAAPVVRSPRPLPAAKHGTEPRTIAVIAGTATSLVGLGIGVGFALDAGAARNDASRFGATANQTGAGSCTVSAALVECAKLHAAVRRENRSRDAADIALTTGALVGAATLAAWILIPDFARSEVGSLKAAPWVGARSSGVVFAGSY